MFGLGDLFQWERFVTPTVIKVFYWLAVVISILLGFAGAVSSLTTMAYDPFVGMIFLIVSLLGAAMGVILARIIAEFVLIVFRINEHLGAIRNRGQECDVQDDRGRIDGYLKSDICCRLPGFPLCRETKVHDVAVRHDIGLALEPHLAGVARAVFAAVSHVIVVADGFRPDESALEVGVDDGGGLRRLGAPRNGPGGRLLGAGGEIGDQIEQAHSRRE